MVLTEIQNFELYDDCPAYKIVLPNDEEIVALLSLDIILKMLEIEGYINADVIQIVARSKSLLFNKVVLIAEKKISGGTFIKNNDIKYYIQGLAFDYDNWRIKE